MTVSKKMVTPEKKEKLDLVIGDLEDFRISNIPKNKSRKSIITISTYSYGSRGIQWHYFSKLMKKK
ncbi:MAG: hypothetical protein ACFE9S_01380 [Candidatus Hermodarchaeota archaeon]